MVSIAVPTDRLDEIEERLPALPAAVLHLQRSTAHAGADLARSIGRQVATAATTVGTTARTAVRTVTGQADSAADRTTRVASDAASELVAEVRSAAARTTKAASGATAEIVGQAKAQGRRTLHSVEDEATGLTQSAIRAVEHQPGSGTPYEEWTKADLTRRATELDVPGRSAMSKAQLIAALRQH